MTARKTEILCAGNALVDVFARGSGEAAARYGITEPVQHIEIERLKAFLSELTSRRENPSPVIYVSGGGAANTAKIAALLGAKARFTGAVGKGDEAGLLFERELRAAGVELALFWKPSPTGLCLVLETETGTRIAASPSAALDFSESDIDEEDIKNAEIVVIDGFTLERAGLARRILSLAEKYGTTAAIDLSSVSIAKARAAEIADYSLKYPLILFMNEAEAFAFYAALAPGMGFPAAKADASAASAAARGDPGLLPGDLLSFFGSLGAGKDFPLVAVKLGARGAIAFSGGGSFFRETSPLASAETTGAGDAFAAAFLAARVRGFPPGDCAALGNAAARIVLDAAGTQVHADRFRDLAERLKGN